jgi:hypothetical protein
MIWPAQQLIAQGRDISIIEQQHRRLMMELDEQRHIVHDIIIPDDVDVVVFQRTTHSYLAQAVKILRKKGVTVVIDVDDDLSTIHPSNPAWQELHPRRAQHPGVDGRPHMHSWMNMEKACREASFITATTPALLKKYAPHGRGMVVPNYLAPHYFDHKHFDSNVIGWPASLGSHPNDPGAVGNAIARLVDEGAHFHVVSMSPGVGKAFGITNDDKITYLRSSIALDNWPRVLADQLGIGIAPLADTKFNASKSWLKPLEMSAVGVPWVASPREDYSRLHKLGAGWLAEKPSDWYKKLRALRGSAELRADLAGRGREVADTLKLEDHAWRWWEAWREAVSSDMSYGTRELTLRLG